MKYIKVRFRLTSPAPESFEAYGFDTVWNKKTQIIGGEAIEPGNVVNFQPITVQADGKCLVVATERNVKALRAMLDKKQITLGGGDTLEPAKSEAKPQEDVWPSEPGAEDEAATDEVAEEAVVKPKRRKASEVDMTADKE